LKKKGHFFLQRWAENVGRFENSLRRFEKNKIKQSVANREWIVNRLPTENGL
jgi:hypothetical protein